MSRSVEAPAGLVRPNDGTSWRADASVVIIVLAAFVSARFLGFMPIAAALVVMLVGIVTVRPRVIGIGLLLLVAWHAGHELRGLEPSPTKPVREADVVVVDDPRAGDGRIRALVDLDGDLLMIDARAATAGDLSTARVGDHLMISGSVRGSRPRSSWAISRRVVGRVSATTLRRTEPARGPTGLANAFRSTVRSGAESMSHDRKVLFTGLVFGDDRGQDVIVADNFRAAGLGHLLAVSGQNVVFVLLLAAPILTRISAIPVRVGAALTVLLGFGFITRFEPSVTRALVMAGLALLAHALGRPGGAAVALPPAVVGLLLFDPLLAWSLAFQLSVAATAGLIVLTPRIAAHVPGPDALVLAISATLGAQLAVSPLLFATFGTVSAVAVPANLLAAPAAAGVMMWGLVAGTLAGLSPEPVAWLLHLPTRAMLWWIDTVAEVGARRPVGHVGAAYVSVLVGLAVILGTRRWSNNTRWCWTILASGAVVLALVPFVSPRTLQPGRHRLTAGIEVVRSSGGHDVLIVSDGARVDMSLAALRQARLGHIDLTIVLDGSRDSGRLIRVLRDRFGLGEIWAPPDHDIPGGRTTESFEGTVGSLTVRTAADGTVDITDLG